MIDLKPDETLLVVTWMTGVTGTEDADAGVFLFATIEPMEALARLREAASDYYHSLPADAEERGQGYNPNWGDAVTDIPDEHWAKFGFRYLDALDLAPRYVVDHDEPLYDLGGDDE